MPKTTYEQNPAYQHHHIIFPIANVRYKAACDTFTIDHYNASLGQYGGVINCKMLDETDVPHFVTKKNFKLYTGVLKLKLNLKG